MPLAMSPYLDSNEKLHSPSPISDPTPTYIGKALAAKIKASAELTGRTILGLHAPLKSTDYIPGLFSADEIGKTYKEIDAQFAVLLSFFASGPASIILMLMQEAIVKPVALTVYVLPPLSNYTDKEEWLRRTFGEIGEIDTIISGTPQAKITFKHLTDTLMHSAILNDNGCGLDRKLRLYLVDEKGKHTKDFVEFKQYTIIPYIFMVAGCLSENYFKHLRFLERKKLLSGNEVGKKNRACIEQLHTRPELLMKFLDSLDFKNLEQEFKPALDRIMSSYTALTTQKDTFFATKGDNSTTGAASAIKPASSSPMKVWGDLS